jgi:hypothetical protein
LEQGIAPAHDAEHLLDAASFRILAAVEIGEAHRLLQVVDDFHRLRGRGVDLFPREIEMRVVQCERDIGEHGDANRRGGDRDMESDGTKAAVAKRQRQASAGQKQHHDGHQPAGEPAQLAELGDAVLHCLSGVRVRASR